MPETSSLKDGAEGFSLHRFILADRFEPPTSALSERDVSADAWAYLMFTSGSTGVPKGVPITHGNAAAYVNSSCSDFNADDRFSQFYDLTFDASIGDLFIDCGISLRSHADAETAALGAIFQLGSARAWSKVRL